MLKFINGNIKNFERKLDFILDKRKINESKKILIVKKIIADVKKNKDKSVLKYEKKFSKLNKIRNKDIKFTNLEINKILKKLDLKTKKSIDLAFTRIYNFHKKQKLSNYTTIDRYKNSLSYISSPISKIGVYVPGGTASYPSSVLMNCIPAIIAGVKNIYMTTPALNKSENPGVIYAATKCNVKEIYKLGGAQAIAAFAYGTSIVKKVDKIVGPGNEYVALAKKEVFGSVGIDMIAGPSEITVVGDISCNPEWVAADLLAQAEHDTYSQSIFIGSSKKIIREVNESLKKQIKELPKKKIAIKSLKNFGIYVLASNRNKIADIVNYIAPEHLEICTKNPKKFLKKLLMQDQFFLAITPLRLWAIMLLVPITFYLHLVLLDFLLDSQFMNF